ACREQIWHERAPHLSGCYGSTPVHATRSSRKACRIQHHKRRHDRVMGAPPRAELDSKLIGETVTIRAGSDLVLDAAVGGKPEPKVFWSKADKELEPGDKYSLTYTSTRAMAIIKSCDRNDTGKYILTVKNASGTKTAAVLVKVLGKNRMILAGSTLHLTATILGRPLPVITWRKTGIDLQSRGFIDTTENTTALTVEKVHRYDAGKYTIEAENPSARLDLYLKQLYAKIHSVSNHIFIF
uniref:Ig-like domain-containing protein n=1 Tax=Astyanax mexicanus TaxID=7994 RepID=A0A3B1JG23_ASTMX